MRLRPITSRTQGYAFGFGDIEYFADAEFAGVQEYCAFSGEVSLQGRLERIARGFQCHDGGDGTTIRRGVRRCGRRSRALSPRGKRQADAAHSRPGRFKRKLAE